MKVVILAGGLGSRISEESHLRPKPMIEIGDRPILWHIMKSYAHYGFREFIVCLGYKGEVIQEYFFNYANHQSDVTLDLRNKKATYHEDGTEPWIVTLARTGIDTQTGGRLLRVRKYLDPGEPFCMTYGDGVADVNVADLVAFHRAHKFEATLTAVYPPARFGSVEVVDGQVTRFQEKPSDEFGHINGGFFVLEPSVIDRIPSDETIWEHEPMESLARDGALGAFVHDGFWHPMDTLRDKRELEKLWLQDQAPWKCWE